MQSSRTKIFKRTKKVLLLLGWTSDGGRAVRNQYFGDRTTFQPYLEMSTIIYKRPNGKRDAVYLSGTLEMTAGEIQPPTVIEAPCEYDIQPSIYAEETFYHLPDLTVPLTVMNKMSVPT